MEARGVELDNGQLASIATNTYRHPSDAHEHARTKTTSDRGAYANEGQKIHSCFTGAQHLGRGVWSQFIPNAKSHPIVYTLTSLDYLTDLSQDSLTQSALIRLCPTQPLRPAPIMFEVQSRTLV